MTHYFLYHCPPYSTVGSKGEKLISNTSYKNPFILAHEYGHTQSDVLNAQAEFIKANSNWRKLKLKDLLAAKKLKKLIRPIAHHLGSPAAMGSTAALLLSDNENIALPTALIGTGATIPMLSEEIKASHTGAKAIKDLAKQNKIPLKILDKLKPYVGVPTYAAVASVPLLTYMFKKLRGRYDKE